MNKKDYQVYKKHLIAINLFVGVLLFFIAVILMIITK